MACYIYKNTKYQSREELESFLEQEQIQFMSTPQGEVYGFVDTDNTIYIDPNIGGVNTLIHEAGHLQYKVLKSASQNDPIARAVYDKARDIVSPIAQKIIASKQGLSITPEIIENNFDNILQNLNIKKINC